MRTEKLGDLPSIIILGPSWRWREIQACAPKSQALSDVPLDVAVQFSREVFCPSVLYYTGAYCLPAVCRDGVLRVESF